MRPAYYRPAPARWAFVDPGTGVAVLDDGRSVFCKPGDRRVKPNLSDLADALAAAGVDRAYLTGDRWPASWFELPATRGAWQLGSRGAFTAPDDPRIDLFRETPAGPQRIDLRRASSWGLPDDVTPQAARDTWEWLQQSLGAAWRPPEGVGVMLSTPTATGQQLLALATPRGWDGEQSDPDTAALLRSTSPQHRIEVPGACWDGCDAHRDRGLQLPDVAEQRVSITYLDARFAYGALVRGIGSGARMLHQHEAQQLAEDPYARARFHVKYTVPEGWEHPGLLIEKHPDGEHWHAPDAPGYSGSTWCDGTELTMARAHGWELHIREAVAFDTTHDVLDKWVRRLLTLWQRCADPDQAPLAAGMVRAIVLRTIGSFHSVGRRVQHVSDPYDVPLTGVLRRRDLPDGRVAYETREPLTGAAAAWARPEWTSQVWGKAHARLAFAPTGGRYWSGFLTLPPDAVAGMWGDALYLTTGDPGWHDDGNPGRYRIRAEIHDQPRPWDLTTLIALRNKIGAA